MAQVIVFPSRSRRDVVQRLASCPCGSGLPARRRYEIGANEWRTRCVECDPVVYHSVERNTASLEGDAAQREARARRRVEDLMLARECGCSVEEIA